MPWYKFDSKDAFDAWHEDIKKDLGYPLPSIDRDGNEIGEPYTTDYTLAYKISDTDFRAVVETEHSTGLIESESPFQRSNHDEANA